MINSSHYYIRNCVLSCKIIMYDETKPHKKHAELFGQDFKSSTDTFHGFNNKFLEELKCIQPNQYD